MLFLDDKSRSLGKLEFSVSKPALILLAPSYNFGAFSERLVTPFSNTVPPAINLFKSSCLSRSLELIFKIPSTNVSIPLFNVAPPALILFKSSFLANNFSLRVSTPLVYFKSPA